MFVYSINENVENVTKSLKSNSSAGLDEIPELLIIQCIYYIKKPLVHNFNASFNSGVFPNKMKIAKVRPLFQNGDRHDVRNYRPISILPYFSPKS